jgi:hypothetical protein
MCKTASMDGRKELTGGLLSLSTLGAQCLGHNSEAALLSYAHSRSKRAPVIDAAVSALRDTMIHDISHLEKHSTEDTYDEVSYLGGPP